MFRSFVLCLLLLPVFGSAQVAFIELESKTVPEPNVKDTAVENWNRSQPGYDRLSKEGREMLYWTNYARRNPVEFWNNAIQPILEAFPTLNRNEAVTLKATLMKVGPLPMFVLNKVLLTTAQSHADDIGKKKAPLGHNSTNGANFGSRMTAAGIKYCANENISLCSQSVLLSMVLLYLDIGVADLGHRKTLLNPVLHEIGVGSAQYGKEENRYFIVQDFACQQ